jgi:hypothetical protein
MNGLPNQAMELVSSLGPHNTKTALSPQLIRGAE